MPTRVETNTSDRSEAGSRFAYQRIADELARCIADGTLPVGTKLPSVRRMSAQWQVSIPTVLHAYSLLEAQRLVKPRPKAGYFVVRRTDVIKAAPPPPLAIPSSVTTGDVIVGFLESVANEGLYPLANSLPDPAHLPTARLARTLGAVARRQSVRSAMVYTPSGAADLRIEIARRALAAQVAIGPDDVVVTNGCTEAIALALRALTRPGQAVAVESPAYFGTLQAIETLGLKALEVATDPVDGIQPDALDTALSSNEVAAIVLTPTVHNPLGFIVPTEIRRSLGIVLDRHAIPVIEDDTYAELHGASERPPSMRAFTRAAPVLTCGSFSKTLASAYRVGWILPGPYRAELLRLKSATSAATSMPAQLAIAEYLRSGGYDHHLRHLNVAVRANRDRIAGELGTRLPAGSRIGSPAGGYLLWVELPEDVDALELHSQCLGRGVSVAPGPVFSATGAHRNFIRINGGLLWSSELDRALDIVAEEAHKAMRAPTRYASSP
jgi:DNA-binding transcriptional MocR family regulator